MVASLLSSYAVSMANENKLHSFTTHHFPVADNTISEDEDQDISEEMMD